MQCERNKWCTRVTENGRHRGSCSRKGRKDQSRVDLDAAAANAKPAGKGELDAMTSLSSQAMAALGVKRFDLGQWMYFSMPDGGVITGFNTATGEIVPIVMQESGDITIATRADCVEKILRCLGVSGVEYQPGKKLFSTGGRALAIDADGGWIKPVEIRELAAIEP